MIPPFLQQEAVLAAPQLLGWKLVCRTPEGITAGYIVETEAYHMHDPASHTFRGMTTRTKPMFQAGGTLYVYFTYGMHFCVNIVTGAAGDGQAVLLRALEPVAGLELMKQRRRQADERQLTNGPGKLTQAMGIGRQHSGTVLGEGSISLEKGFTPETIVTATRIGITKAVDQPWRFYVGGNPYVSRPATARGPAA